MSADSLLSAFIDAQILLAVSFLLWLAVGRVMALSGVRLAPDARLKVLYLMLPMVLLAPFALGYGAALMPQQVASFNLTDMVVAQYLNGSYELRPTQFEALLSARQNFSDSLLTLNGPLAWSVVTGIAAGTLFFILRLISSILRLRQTISGGHVLHRHGKVSVIISDRVRVAFSTRGIRQQYVVLPFSLLNHPRDLRLVLAHEIQHMRQGDLNWEILLEILKPLFFWNPAFYGWKRQVERLRELACDAAVLERSQVDLRGYCDCLIRAAEDSVQPRRLFAVDMPGVTLVETRSRFVGHSAADLLRQRIEHALERKPGRGFRRIMFLSICAPVLAVTLITGISMQKTQDWSQDRLMLSSIVNLERMDRLNGTLGLGARRY